MNVETEPVLKQLLRFSVPGVHTEKLGAANQPWDARVRDGVRQALEGGTPSSKFAWYAVHCRWFIGPAPYRRDIDNLRVKPVLDSLTALGFWRDDNVEYVRRLDSDVELVASPERERLEVIVYGVE